MKDRKKIPQGRNRHHLRPRCRGGCDRVQNMLLIHVERHVYWHKIFGNMTLNEAIYALQRLRRAKRKQKKESY